MNGPLRVIELFAGIGAQASALERLGIDFTSTVCEIDPHAYNAYCAIHGPTPNLGDITKVEHLPECDLITYSFPCLTGETLVQTSEGWKRIDEIKKGDAIYTDDGYREVTDWAMTGIKPVMTVKAASGLPIRCTHYHPFLVRKKSRVWNNGRRSYDRVFSEPEWIEAHDLTKDCYLGFPIPQPKGIPDWDGIDLVWNDGRKSRHINELSELMSNPDFWYTVGRYLADGWIRTQGGIVIAFGKGKWEQSDRLPFNYSGVFERGSVMKAHIPLKELEAFCMQFGKGALNKHIPEEYKTIPKHLAEAMLNGYLDGDGSLSDKGYSITTVSRRLALDLAQLIAYVYERPSSIYHDRRKGTHTIEGRTVNQHDTYTVRFHKDARTQDKAFFENGWIWSPIQELTEISVLAKAEPVYDITVEGRHCFVAEGVLVKNCQDLSVAGNQKGMAEGSETRSALLWEVERLLQDMRERECLPEVLLMENVDAILHKANYPHFQKFIIRLNELGYTSSYAVLNAKDFGVPQNRKRCFMVSTLSKGTFRFPTGWPLELRLKDMLEDNVDESYYLSEERIAKYERHKERQIENGRGFGWKPLDAEREREQLIPLLTTQDGTPAGTILSKSQKSSAGGNLALSNPAN